MQNSRIPIFNGHEFRYFMFTRKLSFNPSLIVAEVHCMVSMSNDPFYMSLGVFTHITLPDNCQILYGYLGITGDVDNS